MMAVLTEFLFHFFFAFLASASFSLLYNAPRRELGACGVAGAVAWVVYYFIYEKTASDSISNFFVAVVAAIFARVFSYTHRAPSTLYLIPGIIPLVPGGAMYYTMAALLKNDIYESFTYAAKTLKVAGVIAIGIIVIFNLPPRLFTLWKPKEPTNHSGQKNGLLYRYLYRKHSGTIGKRS